MLAHALARTGLYVCCLLVLLVSRTPSQTVSGTISGAVVDSSGAVIAGAEVVLQHEGTGAVRRATTGEAGLFVFAALPPATYTVNVEQKGFRRLQRAGTL